MAIRDGFIIPNASTYAPDYQTAQPDQGDFVILGNSQYGVISGCKVSLSGGGVTVGGTAGVPDILVVGGKVRTLGAASNLSITGPDASNPRFDLVVYSLTSSLFGTAGVGVVTGVASINPVFPDVSDVTVLAAVYVPPASGSSTKRVIDKRNFLQTTLTYVGAAGEDASLVNLVDRKNSSGTTTFHIDGNGKVFWENGSAIGQNGTANLQVTGSLSVPNVVASNQVTVSGNNVITEGKISWGTSTPSASGAADRGRIFINTNTGDVSVYKNTVGSSYDWIRLETAVPTGTVIQSFVEPSVMNGQGWLLLDGSAHHKDDAPGLWNAFPTWRSGAGDVYVTLPNMTGRFPLGNAAAGYGQVGDTHGLPNSYADGSISVTISENQMPTHSHRTSNSTSTESHAHGSVISNQTGSHSHGGKTGQDGLHNHGINDPGHTHYFFPTPSVVLSSPGSKYQIDGPYNDNTHVDVTDVSNPLHNVTGITIRDSIKHDHTINPAGDHFHTFTIPLGGEHSHTLPPHSPKGGNQPITITPPSMNIYFYIKM